ncbi:MAG: OmpA family protein [Alloprevotella sp.]|nr:OmpA family protein [Bacteroidales bacterium]MDY3942962.1 OmpA family protein [Alloprevotella sp.]
MKKIFTLAAAAAMVATASAQNQATALSSHKFLDNWSVGVNVGAVSPVQPFSWSNLQKRARLTFGLELTKQWSPVFATGIEGGAYVNTTPSHTAIDQVTGVVFGKVNFSNLFLGYKGTPRTFEVQGRGGFSYNYNFVGGATAWGEEGTDFFGAKFGLDFDFNLGESKAWTVSVKPAITYNLDGQHYQGYGKTYGARFEKSDARFELTAGLTYHFKNSNGYHHFINVRPYDQAEVDGLNAQINSLRGQLGDKDAQINGLNGRLNDLQNQLNAARNQKPTVVQKTTKDMDIYVYFKQGKSFIERAQEPNVERIAIFLKNNKDAKVVIKGYASPEGNAELNQKLSTARAEAVKTALVKRYKIAADRISTEGLGVGNVFSEPEWNRVSIGTIEKN